MIITRLIGGLGNQMFQYAAGRRIAITNNTELKLDITWYENQGNFTPREYLLHVFNIKENFATKNEINKLKKNSFVWKILRKINPLFKNKSYIKEKTLYFDTSMLNIGDNLYLAGYWGSEKYFKDIKEIIRKDFTFKQQPDEKNKQIISRILHTNSISIHIRRGDYVSDSKTNLFHGICKLGYYHRSIEYIANKIKDPYFLIFSDDPLWTKQNFHLKFPCVYVDHNVGKKDYEDMRLISECKHNIIANSTFSWWGAWLNQNPNKIVIAPKKWFRDKSMGTKDLLPKSWIKI